MNDGKVIELLSEMLIEMRGFRQEMKEVKEEMKEVKQDIRSLKDQQAKTNIALHELRLSVVQLADKFESILDLEHRLSKVEAVVFKG